MVSGISHPQVESDKRVRREIANSNERRRMQSINSGFDTLRLLLPPIQDVEKMSKATILQLTAKYINSLVARVSALENEVATYQQNSPMADPIPSNTCDNIMRKRRNEEIKPLECFKYRRHKVDETFTSLQTENNSLEGVLLLSQNLGPLSPGPDNSAYESPISGSDSSTAACLEHLVMAIEQIEGNTGCQSSSPEQNSSNGSLNSSPVLSNEVYDKASPIQQKLSFIRRMNTNERVGTVLKPTISPYTDEMMFTNGDIIPDINLAESTLLSDKELKSNNISEKGYANCPIVAKLLKSAIPHKYLHRPQVVVNSSH